MFVPADANALTELRRALTGDARTQPLHLQVAGREVTFADACARTVRVTFSDLCGQALGSGDYAALADATQALFIDNIPQLHEADRNTAIRFRRLIDIWYERRLFLAYGAAAAPEALYAGYDAAFEFERTVSRLREMASAEYIEGALTRS